MAEKFGVRPMGVAMFAMPGVPNGVCPPNIATPPKGVAPGLLDGVWPLWGVAPLPGVASWGVASAPPGVAPDVLFSVGVSSQRARFFFGAPAAPGVGVSPHCPGVGVSPSSPAAPGVSSHWPFPLPPSSSSSSMIGVSTPLWPPVGVSHLSPPGFSASATFGFFFSASPAFPVLLSQRPFFFSPASSALPSAFRSISSSFCFWTFRRTSCFSLSSCCPIITSL
mmetsp:Transcript_241/g.847  ORF Transcript_241/g.847 Transcript_241/m.847 type:complete len:223 (-) Transcript_241:436-1104(-)